MDIQTIEISKLNPAKYNPRKDLKPGDPEYDKLKKSLTEFDLVEPLIWNKRTGNLVGGHQRLKILQERGDTEVEVSVVDLPGKKEKALNLALNKISGEWDFPKLKDLLEELDTGDFDIEITGFDDKEIEDLMTQFHVPEEGLTDDDEIPGKVETICKAGDLWRLDNHRLLCGDATVEADVAKLMAGEKADMVFTDPPYGVNYGADQDLLNKKSGNKFRLVAKPIIGDNLTTEECAEQLWKPAFRNLYEVAKDDCSFYMTMCQGGDQMMMMMMMSEHWQIKHELIWVKSSPVFSMGRLDYDYQHEPILFGWKKKHNFYGEGQFTKSIWEIPKPSKSDLHPTMKPIALIENALANSSRLLDIILDLFGGSGSTLIACEKLGRRCFMMEIDEHYCDVIIERWQNFTGNQAVKLND